MADETLKRRDDFIQSTKNLFSDIRQWLSDIDLKIDETTIPIDEPPAGVYQAPKLTIRDNNRKIMAELVPVGANILAADWRVDFVGPFEKEIFVHWSEGAPEIEQPKPNVVQNKRRLFKNADEPGWYWIEDTHLGKARRLSKELLVELLEEVQNP
jgi:hypothetical protein